MKALVKTRPDRGLTLMDVPKPTIGPKEVLIKVKKASICGTDLHIWSWDQWAKKNVGIGTTIGHEFSGIVEAVGSEVKTVSVGERVSAESHITCGVCHLCQTERRHLCEKTRLIGVHRNGAFAEYIAMPEENIFPLPSFVPDEIGSLFDPYGNAVHTADQSQLKGADVLITGAGPIGIMAAAVAKQRGARNIVITDINEYRLGLAKKMGATHTINIDETAIEDVVKDMEISVGMEMSGAPSALNDILEHAENGAHISLLGILPESTLIDWDLVIFKMLTLKGIYGREIFKTWHEMTDLIKDGLDLRPIITHTLKLEEFEQGFEAMLSGDSGKVVMEL